MIRTIRVLGAALGALVGLGIAATGTGLFTGVELRRVHPRRLDDRLDDRRLRAAPVPHRRAGRLADQRASRSMSTAEFVAAVLGLFVGLLLGLLLSLPLAQIEGPLGTWLPLGISLFLGLGMMGLTVAKRYDLIAAAEGAGLVRRPGTRSPSTTPTGPQDRRGHQRPHRRPDRRDRGVRLHLRHARRARVSCSRSCSTSPTRRTRCGATAAGAASRSSTRMQRDPRTPIEIVEDEAPGIAEVDAKLVELAKRRSRVVLTNDFNLNRVAELQGVRVMNINSLANAVKPAVLPGEELRVKVIQEGKEAGQGVGLPRRRHDDRRRGRRAPDRPEVDLTVTRVLQTVAGRMIFAQPRLD